MNIVERSLVGKQVDQSLCEDGIFISNDFIAVIDGVTSKGELLWNGHKSGIYAKDLIINLLKEIPSDISNIALLNSINNLFKHEFAKRNISNSINEYLRASLIIYSKHYKEVWSYGDCQCIINAQYYPHTKIVDEYVANIRALFIDSFIENNLKGDTNYINTLSREAINVFLQRQLYLENKNSEFSYGVLNGQPINSAYLNVYTVESGAEVILGSDGYPRLFSTLKESEGYLKKILVEDPLCYKRYKSTKGVEEGQLSFDDRAYIKFITE
ncbi:hypothetical protein ACQKL6_14450 [Peribacillus sp. NPDC097197]|uniref:hypothetical protein n=1 Tax=unclassified Peribacillus TaxID=2675266 RepID=UPI00380B370A